MNGQWFDPQSRPMITPSEVLEYLYCPRFTYFLNVMRINQNEDKRFKVLKGRRVHEERSARNKKYLRKKILTVKKETEVYLADTTLGIRGIVDEILFLKDGSLSPVDYKYTQYKDHVFRTHIYQLVLYGLLIEHNYKKEVNR
ncbi:MAG: CRISPR-associated protein Cas4, partial [Candidatus Marinimicrobia bacterium]|nr:CRISPR-associated protein Cas4 [Candidatus Neomarinimicrobiota bacterium]